MVEGDEIVYRAGAGSAEPHVGLRLPVNASLSGLSVTLGDIVMCDDSELDSRVDREAARAVGARSMVIVPLAHRGATAGVLKVYSGSPRAFSERELRILQMMAGTLGSALVRADLLERLELAATTDPITGLVNRRVWEERVPVEISRAGRTGDPLTVAVLDLDRFKEYNDRLGHAAGDRLLGACAARWLAHVRAVDVLARIGGEEFGLLLPDCTAAGGLEIMRRLSAAGRELRTFSAGLSEWRPGETGGDLVSRADEALYEAKRRGRDACVVAETSRLVRLSPAHESRAQRAS